MSIVKINLYCQTCKKTDVELMKSGLVKRKTYSHQYFICRECNNRRQRRYYKNNSDRCKEIIRKSIVKNAYKHDARLQLHRALRSKEIMKPESCSNCGNFCKRIEGHHTDYSRPLDVKWLCSSCHAQAHIGVV